MSLLGRSSGQGEELEGQLSQGFGGGDWPRAQVVGRWDTGSQVEGQGEKALGGG